MASGIVKRQGNRFDAVYEQPWGGVASNADPADIPPNCNTFCDGIFIKNGRFCSAGWAKAQVINFSSVAAQNYFTPELVLKLFTILQPSGAYILCALTDLGNLYYYDLITAKFVLDQQIQPAGTLQIAEFDIQIIAGVVYISLYESGEIWAYTPQVSVVMATDFVGGKYLMELVGYLVAANTIQPTDTPQAKFNRYNWSAPFRYTTWDPAIDRTAGFNTISEVQDEITQIFALGNVGYVLRDQGISQLTPTGQALAPFAVTPLWESEFGIGCTYPDTFSQYGAVAMWANDNNIYAFFNGSMPQEITGAAKAAIYADINIANASNENVVISGAFFNCSENSKIPELTYVLSIIHWRSDRFTPVAQQYLTGIFWTLNMAAKTWTRQVVNLLNQITPVIPGLAQFTIERANVQGVLYTSITVGHTPEDVTKRRVNGILILNGVFSTVPNGPGAPYSFLYSFYNSDKGEAVAGGGDISTACDFQFKQEEVRLGTQPTIRGVLVKAAGTGTLNVSVNGVVFSPIVLISTTPKVYRSSGVYTGENPQLNIFGTNFEGVVIKANMLITYDEGEPL